eukprot:gene452-6863_t
MSEDKTKQNKNKFNKKPKFDKKKNPYGWIKTLNYEEQTGTISMGSNNPEAFFHFKELQGIEPKIDLNVTFNLIEVGKNENPIATKIELGRNPKEKEKKKEEQPKILKKEEKTNQNVEGNTNQSQNNKKKDSKENEIKKGDVNNNSNGYDVEKLKSMEKELKTKLTHLDSVIESVTKERDDVRKYLQITSELIELTSKPVLSPSEIKKINLKAKELISEGQIDHCIEILENLSSEKIYNDVLFPLYETLYNSSALEMSTIEKVLHLMYGAMKIKNKMHKPIFENLEKQRNLVIKYNRIANLRNFNLYVNIVNILIEKSPVNLSMTLPQLGRAKYDILTKCQSYISMLLISNPTLMFKMKNILSIVTGKLEDKEIEISKNLRQLSLHPLKHTTKSKESLQNKGGIIEQDAEEIDEQLKNLTLEDEVIKTSDIEETLHFDDEEEEEDEEGDDEIEDDEEEEMDDEFPEITKEAKEIATKLQSSEEVLKKKEALRKEIETILCKVTNQKCDAHIYGSSESTFGLKGSDLDLCVRVEGHNLNNDVKAQTQLLQLLHEAIEDGKLSKNLQKDSSQLIKSSRVPVVKVHDQKRNLECDVCIDNYLAVLNTRMLRTYSLIDPRLRELVLCVKLWAKKRLIADPPNGSLSSYSYAILSIFYLQQVEPPILPSLQELATIPNLDKSLISEPQFWNAYDCSYFSNLEKLSQYWKPKKNNMSIGELLNGFFDFYVNKFEFKNQLCSIREGKILSKKPGMSAIAIEDPFERRDLGKVLLDDVAEIIIEEFNRAHTKLSDGAKFEEICEESVPDGDKINRYAYVKQDYPEHLSIEEMEAGIKNKTLFYGVLRVNKLKFREAYVTVSEYDADILINDFIHRNRAIHGDIVVLKINDEEKNQKNFTGTVVGIKEKKSPKIFAGTIMKEEGKSKGFRWLLPLEKAYPKIMIEYSQFREVFNTKASNTEDLVIVAEMMTWKVNQHYPKGKLKGNLGLKRDLWAQKRSILIQSMPQLYDQIFLTKNDKLEHNAKIEKVDEIEEFDKDEYEDWREKCIFTIDPLQSRDLDDALSVYKIDKNRYQCYVVIADVSKFVEEGSQIDKDAQQRGTSVYMVDCVEHMLEPTLSQNLASLLPGVTRYGLAVQWIMNSKGEIEDDSVEFHRVVMKSCVKLDYDTVQEFIDGKKPKEKPIYGDYSWDQIKSICLMMNELGQALRKKRKESGSVFLQRDEHWFDLNDDGFPTGVHISEHSESHQLVEEFMLLANQLAAKEMYNYSNEICIIRKHDSPDMRTLSESLTRYVNAFNTYIAKDKFDINALLEKKTKLQEMMNMLFEEAKDHPLVFKTFQHALLREMKLAQYDVPPEEGKPFHFALNMEFYTHFTSPIRRYADLIVHRLLLKSMKKEKQPNITKKDFKILVDHINDQANKAKNIQEQCGRIYSCYYLIPKLQEGLVRIEAVVLSLGRRSFTVLIPSFGVELKIQIMKRFDPIPDHIQDIESDIHTEETPNGDEEETISIEKLILTWNATEEHQEKKIELYCMKAILIDIDLDFQAFPIDFYAFNIWEINQKSTKSETIEFELDSSYSSSYYRNATMYLETGACYIYSNKSNTFRYEKYSCTSGKVLRNYFSDNECTIPDGSTSTYTEGVRYSSNVVFYQYNQYNKIYVKLKCSPTTIQSSSVFGSYEYVFNDKVNKTCASLSVPKIYGTANCIRTSSSYSKKTVCREGNILETFTYNNRDCSGHPYYSSKQAWNFVDKPLECDEGVGLVKCIPYIAPDYNDWIIAFPAIVPVIGLCFIVLLFLRGNIFVALKHAITFKFKDASKALKIDQLFKLNLKQLQFFYMESVGRLMTSILMFANFVMFIVIIGLQIHWRLYIGYCEKYGILNEAFAFYITFSALVVLITFSLMWTGTCFCAGFFQTNNETDRSLMHFTGIYNGDSLYYFNGVTGIRHRTDVGSMIGLMLISIMNALVLAYGVIVIILSSGSGCNDSEVFAMAIICLIIGSFSPIAAVYFIICLINIIIGCITSKANIKLPTIPKMKNISGANLMNSESPEDNEEELDVSKEKESDMDLLLQTKAKEWNNQLFMYYFKINGLSKYEKNLGFLSPETFKGIEARDLYENGVTDQIHQRSILSLAKSINLLRVYQNHKNKPETWNTDQVIEFLDHCEIHNASSLVKKYAVNGSLLKSFKDSELFKILDLDYTLINDLRIKFILNALDENPRFYEVEGYESWNNNKVQKFFNDCGLGEYQRKVRQLRLFGALIPNLMVVDCLKEMEIKEIHVNSVLTAFENISFNFMTIQEVLDWVTSEFDKSLQSEIKKNAIHGALLLTMEESYICEMFTVLRDNRLKRKAFIDKIDMIRSRYKMIVRPLNVQNVSSMNPEYSMNPENFESPINTEFIQMGNNNTQFTSNDQQPSFNPFNAPTDYKVEEYQPNGPPNQFLNENISGTNMNSFNPVNAYGTKEDEDKLCKICFDAFKTTLTLPCAHLAMCEKCADLVTECPICRESISSRIKAFSV